MIPAVAWLVLMVSAALASPRSEVLVAKGEVALHQGRDGEARERFDEAIAADPADAQAHEGLGRVLMRLGARAHAIAAFERALALDPASASARRELARARGDNDADGASNQPITVGELGRLPSVRSGSSGRRWGASLTVGVQYDSNVILAPHGRASRGFGDQDDAAFVFAAGGEYNVVERDDLLVRLEYDLYQTIHPDLHDFDFRAHQPRATVSWGVLPWLWFGTQAGYNHYTLGPHSYLGEPYAMPFVSLLEESWGLTQLIYRHGEDTYFAFPFDDVEGSSRARLPRNGPNDTISLNQSLYLARDRYLTLGYQYSTEVPSHPDGNAFQIRANQVYAGGGSPAPWGMYIDLLYIFRYDDYTKRESGIDPISGVRVASSRRDDGHFLYAGITRPIMEHVSLAVTYYGAFNGSNVPSYDYSRSVIGTMLQVTY